MKIVIQRVNEAECQVDGSTIGSIEKGLVLFVGVGEGDTEENVQEAAEKIIHLRIFNNDEGKMDLSLDNVNGSILIIPNFTLCADLNRGRRPSFDRAAPPGKAENLYESLIKTLNKKISTVKTGKFGAEMDISVNNKGPVTLDLEV